MNKYEEIFNEINELGITPENWEEHIIFLIEFGKDRLIYFNLALNIFSGFAQIDEDIILRKYLDKDIWAFENVLTQGKTAISLHNKGLTRIDLIAKDKGKPCEMEIYQWNYFKIFAKFHLSIGSGFFYSIYLNGIHHEAITLKEMRKLLEVECYQADKGKNNITIVLNQYCNSLEDSSHLVKKGMGFFDEGWVLPGLHIFNFREGNQKNIYENIKKMMKLNVDNNIAKRQFRRIYECTTISNKDYVFAWNLAAPFMTYIKQKKKSAPFLSMGGEADVGKSAIGLFFAKNFWGSQTDVVLSSTSTSNMKGRMSASTFPLILDEAEFFTKSFINDLKSHATTMSPFRRKKGQDLDVDSYLLAPLMLTYNRTPEMFELPEIRTRDLDLEIVLYENTTGYDWDEETDKYPIGYFGKYIISKTMNWTGKDIMALLNKMDDQGLRTKRAQIIAKLLSLGKWFAKEYFGLELNISNLPTLIRKTQMINVTRYLELLRIYSRESFKKKNMLRYSGPKWISSDPIYSEIKHVNGEVQYGMLVDINIKNEILSNVMDYSSAKRRNLTNLYNILRAIYPNMIEPKTFTHKGAQVHALFVPSVLILGINYPIPSWYEMDLKSREFYLEEAGVSLVDWMKGENIEEDENIISVETHTIEPMWDNNSLDFEIEELAEQTTTQLKKIDADEILTK